MKLIDLLSKEEKNNIQGLIDNYDKNSEFEVSMFSNKETSNQYLSLERFTNLISVLNKVSKKSQKTSELDVIFSLKTENNKKMTNYRITIDTIEKINEYMSMLHQRKNHLVFSVLAGFINDKNKKDEKIKIIKKTKNIDKYITVEDIFSRFKLDKEEEVSKEELEKLSKIHKNYQDDEYIIIYRLKERSSYYIEKEKNVFRIDLTTTRTSKIINNIENSPFNYEIEIECEMNDKSKLLNNVLDVCEFIIKIIQQSNHIITKSMINKVITEYKMLLSISDDRNKLYGRKPISLEVQHLVDYLPNKYAITDKADGERYMLIVLYGRCFLISTNLFVRDTGLEVDEKYNKTIIDGEYIFIGKLNKYLYMAFDCMMYSGKDLREESKFMERIKYADKFIEIINKSKYEHKSVLETKININEVDKVVEYHKNNIIEFFNDIDNELNKKETKILIRRKYFLDVNGVQDNEIFKYSSLLWNMYMTGGAKFPYHLDGLIYHPLDQKYIVEIDKIKYFEYKWKPPTQNSIDFYIEFEKDRATKKILTVFDNSVDNTVKNKPYYIANLHVYQSIKGVQKPVLFNATPTSHICNLYLGEDGLCRSIDGKIINDKTVVECYYNMNADIAPEYRWTVMRTRYDKTEAVNKHKTDYGNYYDVALKVWRSIMNPVLPSDLIELSNDGMYERKLNMMKSKIDIELLKMDKTKAAYYQKKSKLVEHMNAFNNFAKSCVIYEIGNPQYVDNIKMSFLDSGCGRGGDIQKFYFCECELMVGIDPDLEGLINATDGAITRYNQQKKTHRNFPPMYWINANPSSILTLEEQEKTIGRMNKDNKDLINKFLIENRIKYDRWNASYSIHYNLESKETWSNYCRNIRTLLREGGYMTFCTFDGDQLMELLKDKEKITEYYTENGEKKILYEIIRKYDVKSKENTGLAVDVHMNWISEDGVYQREYIVKREYITKSLKEECELELVDTLTFKELYENTKGFIELGAEMEVSQTKKFFNSIKKFYEENEMNDKCRIWTYMFRYYIFRRKENNLEEIKKKYYGSDRIRVMAGSFGKAANRKF
jgi:hypothetical protein